MRKLATIQKILNIEPIEGADRIVKATVLGWEVVIQKDEHKVGDLVIYCEVDSILPDKSEFEFLRQRKFRIKTIKLKGQISQGIIFPLSILPNGKYNEGDDVTDIIGVKKYDPEGDLERRLQKEREDRIKSKTVKFFLRYKWYRNLFNKLDRAPFPHFIPKTDEDRIQLFPNICQEHKDTKFELTIKLDGQSATYFVVKNNKKWQFWKPYLFGVCSRNFQLLKEDNSSWWDVARKYNIKDNLINYAKSNSLSLVYIQGEIIGPGIQSNKYQRNQNELYIFNMADNLKEKYTYSEMHNELSYYTDIPVVPFIAKMNLLNSIPETINWVRQNSMPRNNFNIIQEGIVWKSIKPNFHFKVINPDFLLKFEESDEKWQEQQKLEWQKNNI